MLSKSVQCYGAEIAGDTVQRFASTMYGVDRYSYGVEIDIMLWCINL